MLPPGKQMVLNVEYNLAPVSVPTVSGSEILLVGFIDYTVVVTQDERIARELSRTYLLCFSLTSCESLGYLLNPPGIAQLSQQIESVLGFFVVEAKQRGLQLEDYIPRVLTELYAAAMKLKCGS